jgi:protein-S-isoprenylcysteine O-methyltransferase Ste14
MVVWSAFLLSWIGAAFWADRAEKRPARREAWLYRAVTVAGVVLLVAGGEQFTRTADRSWFLEPVEGYALVLVVLSGLAFTWWARLYLGRLSRCGPVWAVRLRAARAHSSPMKRYGDSALFSRMTKGGQQSLCRPN